MAISPNGQLLAATSNTGRHAPTASYVVHVWDFKSREKRHLLNHPEDVDVLAFAPDSRTLISGSYDQKVRLWDLTSGKVIVTLPDTAVIEALALCPDGRTLVTAGGRGTPTRVWNLDRKEITHTLKGDHVAVSLAVSSDGRTLVTGNTAISIDIYALPSGKHIRSLIAEGLSFNHITAVTISPRGDVFASGTDGIVQLWDLASGRSLRTIAAHNIFLQGRARVLDLAFSPNGRILASSGSEGSIKLWDWERGRLIATLAERSSRERWFQPKLRVDANSVAFSPTGDILAAGYDDQTIRLWSVPPSL